MSEKTPEERLVLQARAITDLRKRVERLEKMVLDLAPAQVSGNPVPLAEGGWYMKPTCLTCGRSKEAGREHLLSCKACGKAHTAHSKSGFKDAPKYTTCGWCGEDKAPTVQIQCPACQAASKVWKAKQTLAQA